MKNDRKLTVTAQGDQEIVMTRVFDAPRALVFEAWTRPELVKRWLGVFNGWTLDVCEIDLRVGGACRYVWRNAKGASMGMRGVFREVASPERLVSTEQFDDAWYEGEGLTTVHLAERNGVTTLTQTLRYVSATVRDTVLRSPMERGVAASFDNLAEILASRASGADAGPSLSGAGR